MAITIFVLISGFSFSTKSVKAAESDKAITAFTVPIQARTLFEDDFNSYNDGDLEGQGGWTLYSGSDGPNVQGVTVFEGAKAVQNGANLALKSGDSLTDGQITFYMKTLTSEWPSFMLCQGAAINMVQVLNFGDGSGVKYYNGVSWVKLGDTPAGWFYVTIFWRSSDHKISYIFNGGAQTGWDTPYNSWTAMDGVGIQIGGANSYVDYIAENPYAPAVGRSQGLIF